MKKQILISIIVLLSAVACSSVIIIGKHNTGQANNDTKAKVEMDSISVFDKDISRITIIDTLK